MNYRIRKMDVEFQISPRMLCACGKTVRAMTETERLAYDDALRRLADGRAEESALASVEEEVIFKIEPKSDLQDLQDFLIDLQK